MKLLYSSFSVLIIINLIILHRPFLFIQLKFFFEKTFFDIQALVIYNEHINI